MGAESATWCANSFAAQVFGFLNPRIDMDINIAMPESARDKNRDERVSAKTLIGILSNERE
ncbi:MAG: hypothetical protein DRQ60_03355 [Gammaproteobacteria bacterium]|nr:MAG: hypothetical protein DRQ52_05590 [Gammaproteobacteria bacterium]RLA16906.1 MAG: hypothetical protein DRQ60_03355 [Gammaproteobacteria bacterium]